MTDLLARFAECAFWMGRYMERAENLARAIDVNESFARDSRAGGAGPGHLQRCGRGLHRHDRRGHGPRRAGG
ncbi:MAG: alpha-E domain-containing protein [Proteobacteria bacterium]|nr:alpha-E domain-containing protein [Pseudomonadota bacterium]